MVELNFPKYDFKLKKDGGRLSVYDECRRKFVALTPEEWVRQNMVRFLVAEKHFPAARIANEVEVDINGMHKRCDTVVYDAFLTPFLIAEYKAPSVRISQKVFDQIATYCMGLDVRLLIVSNGLEHYCCQLDHQQKRYVFYREIPDFTEIFPTSND